MTNRIDVLAARIVQWRNHYAVAQATRLAQTVRRMVTHWGNGPLNLLFVPECAFCRRQLANPQHISLCDSCINGFAPLEGSRCLRCGTRIAAAMPEADKCRDCRRFSLKFDALVAVGAYRAELQLAARRLKLIDQEPLTFALSKLLWNRCGERLQQLAPDVVAPVPMHWRQVT